MENNIISKAIKEVEAKIIKETEKEKEVPLLYEKEFRKINPGMVVKGVVMGKSKDGFFISVGLKEEGIIPWDELSLKTFKDPSEVINIGDEIEVIVLSCNNGRFVLSKKRLDLKNALDKLDKAFRNNETLSGIVSSQVKGGLLVDLGIPGFIPTSYIKKEPVRNLDSYVGKEVRFKVIEFDRKKMNIILSLKKAEEEEERERKERLLNSIKEGDIIKGKVIKLTEFGIFVDIGGLDGLVPVSEISYKRIKHPKDVLKNGQEVSASVIKIDRENKKVSLSIKNTLPSPWRNIEERLSVGSIVTGRVSKVMPTYAFVSVDEVEGFLPKREMNNEVPKEDQEVMVKIIELNPKDEKMVLSLKGVKEDDIERFFAKSKEKGFKIGEILKNKYKKDRKWR